MVGRCFGCVRVDKVPLEPLGTERGTGKGTSAHWFVRFGFGLAGTELAWRGSDVGDLVFSPAKSFSDEGGQAGSAREVGRKTRQRAHGRLCSKFKGTSGAARGVDWVVLFSVLVVVCSCVLMRSVSHRAGCVRRQHGQIL